MANTAILAIRIISDASKAAAGIDQTNAKVSKLSKAGSVAGKMLATGFVVAAAGAVKMTKAASEDAAAADKLKQTLQAAAGATDTQVAAVERWITAQGKAKGVADDELRPALAKLTAATGSVHKAQKLASLAMDIAAARGISLATATSALEKAQNGSLGGLSRLGVKTKDAAGQTKSLAAVTKDLSRLYGGAASRAAQTAAGRQKILSVQMGELGEKIGTGLLPVMEKLTTVGLKTVDWISKNTGKAKALAGAVVGLLVVIKALSVAGNIANSIQQIQNATWIASTAIKSKDIAITLAQKSATIAASAATKAAAAAQWLFNAAMSANPIGLIIIAVIALVAAIVIAYKKSETFRNIVQAVGRGAAQAFGWVVDAVKRVVSWVKDKIGPAFAKAKAAAVLYLKLITLPTRILIAVIITLVKWIVGKWVAAFKVVKAVATPVLAKIRDAAGWVVDKIADIVGWIKDRVVAAFNRWKDLATNVFGKVRDAAGWVIDKISAVVSKVRDVLGPVFSGLKDKALGPINAIKDAFSGVWDMVQRIIGAVGDLIGKIANIKLPNLPDIPGLRVSAPSFRPGAVAGGDTYVVNVTGALDPDAVALQIESLLARRARRIGSNTLARRIGIRT